ncbi:MAG TPA: MFS transporter [Sulfolobales archaeon]|nr:MFS transporter [Sulfolobales archaeon]
MRDAAQYREIEARVFQKVTRRLIPYLFVLYIIAFLDRVNLGYAALDMNKALALSGEVFGLASGIFFIGYFIFEIPSNVLLHMFGASFWIARIMISWGVVAMLTAFVENALQLYIVRFFLGVAEAGFFPGIILYLTYWFRSKEQARAVALFMTAVPISSIIGAPVSTWIMDNIHWLGLPGWRWLFILEGLPAVIFGIASLFYLTDKPAKATWLTQEEKAWLISQLEEEAARKPPARSKWDALRYPRVWHFSLIYFTLVTGLYGIGFWMPTIVKGLSQILTNTQVGILVAIPYIFGSIAMVLWGRHSDRTGERKLHTAIPLILGALGLIGSGLTVAENQLYLSLAMMIIATIGIYSFLGPFWSFANTYLNPEIAPVGIALINSIGNLGGFLGPYIVGYLKDTTGTTYSGLYFLAVSLIVSAILTLAVRQTKQTK